MGLQLIDPRAGQPAMETEDDFGRGLDRVDLQHGFNSTFGDLLSHALCSQRLPCRALENGQIAFVTFQVQSASRDDIIEDGYVLRASCLDDAGPC